jgi:hypothetical protein
MCFNASCPIKHALLSPRGESSGQSARIRGASSRKRERTDAKGTETRIRPVSRSFFEFARPAAASAATMGESGLSTERDTCFLNIIWRHRTPWFISGWRRGIHQPSWEQFRVPVQPNGGQRETHGQGHDRNRCTLNPGRPVKAKAGEIGHLMVEAPRGRTRRVRDRLVRSHLSPHSSSSLESQLVSPPHRESSGVLFKPACAR